jgi:hypothetical protein
LSARERALRYLLVAMTGHKLKRIAATTLVVSIAVLAITHAAAVLMHHFEWYDEFLFSALYVAAHGTVWLAALSIVVLLYFIVSSAILRLQRPRT